MALLRIEWAREADEVRKRGMYTMCGRLVFAVSLRTGPVWGTRVASLSTDASKGANVSSGPTEEAHKQWLEECVIVTTGQQQLFAGEGLVCSNLRPYLCIIDVETRRLL